MGIKPDDYFNNGLIEVARFGTHTIMKNNMNSVQHEKMIKRLRKRYPKIKRKIDKLVLSIKKQVTKCDPVQLLSFSSDMFLMSNLGISSEIQLSKEKVSDARMTEYIQSIFVSAVLRYNPTSKDPSRKFFRIQRKIEKLYSLMEMFYICWAACLEKIYPNYNDEIRRIIIESQLLYMVRGHRYQAFEIEYYEKLLKSHNEIFVSIFGVSYVEIIDGIKKLQYALSQGKFAAINSLGELIDEFYESGETDLEKFKEEHLEEGKIFTENFLGTKLRNVVDVTNWPEKFIRSLSWELNECLDFYNEEDFSGWPIIDLPIQKRPFIKIKEQFFCFDYYSFIDNFYRSIQKAISREDPDYKWSDFQKEASENMVADVFAQILPGCEIYRDNYYPKNRSVKNLVENDLILKYENILLIIEVKAGSFVYTPPITDFENHIRSYKNLIEKADHQCKNTYDYLMSMPVAQFYNQNGSKKMQIDMSRISDTYMITVTIDNINDFAARAEKLNFLQLKCNAISLSIDDLMVYREYFDSPLIFLHFLKQRRQATQESKLALNDELDHLGMYIKHNMYCLQLNEYPDDAEIKFYGYREDLDEYFCSLYHPQLEKQKPSLELPDLFISFIKYLTNSNIEMKVEIADYLLNFASDAKVQLCEQIRYALMRQSQIKCMIAFSSAGDDDSSLRYTGFVGQPNIKKFTDEYKREYVLSTLLWNGEKERVLLDFQFDKNDNFKSLKFIKYTTKDIKDNEHEILFNLGKSRALERVKIYLQQHEKIENDEYCPCGSGKIYEKCCGRNTQL